MFPSIFFSEPVCVCVCDCVCRVLCIRCNQKAYIVFEKGTTVCRMVMVMVMVFILN